MFISINGHRTEEGAPCCGRGNIGTYTMEKYLLLSIFYYFLTHPFQGDCVPENGSCSCSSPGWIMDPNYGACGKQYVFLFAFCFSLSAIISIIPSMGMK